MITVAHTGQSGAGTDLSFGGVPSAEQAGAAPLAAGRRSLLAQLLVPAARVAVHTLTALHTVDSGGFDQRALTWIMAGGGGMSHNRS